MSYSRSTKLQLFKLQLRPPGIHRRKGYIQVFCTSCTRFRRQSKTPSALDLCYSSATYKIDNRNVANWRRSARLKPILAIVHVLRLQIVWSLARRRETRRLTRLQTIYHCGYGLCHSLLHDNIEVSLKSERIGSGQM